nr:bifunctional ATP-dependent DNA helicase/DNA polymerase III subunit epsilon [Klebsiella pneumoniae]
MKPISCRISPVSTLASRSPAASCWTGERHHHCLPHRTERHSAAAKCADRPAQSAQDFRLQLGDPGYRGNLRELLADSHIQRALLLLDDALELCYDVAKLSLGRSALLDAAFERATLYRGRLKRLKEINQPGYSYWYECTSRHFTLALTPLTVAEKFKEVMAQKSGSWIFTSATLSVNDDLHHFTARLGIDEAQTLLLPSPFDYQHQALLCVPRNLPCRTSPARRDTGGDAQAADRGQRWSLLYVVHLARHDARSG